MNTQLLAVIGDPILHSKSPLIFNTLCSHMGVDAVYFRLAASSATEALKIVKDLNLRGVNVTAPFKEEIIPLLDEVDQAAGMIGSVNAVVREEGGLKGYNTDYLGVSRSLEQHGVHPRGKTALVLGAGGAARAAAYALLNDGAQTRIANRTPEKARQLARDMNCEAIPFDSINQSIKTTDILISTLPPKPEIVSGLKLRKELTVFDANYKASPLSHKALRESCRVIMGEDWLLNQALPAFKLFLGRTAGDDAVKASNLRSLLSEPSSPAPRKIAVAGFMGTGKTACGKELAKALEFAFTDLDSEIEIREGRGIPDIFKQSGEEYFRTLEKKILRERLAAPRNTVIALGGGAIMDAENRAMLNQSALTIWLHTPVATALKRIPAGSRPLLETENPEKRARELLAQRLPLYARAAQLLVSSEQSVAETVEKICNEILKTYSF